MLDEEEDLEQWPAESYDVPPEGAPGSSAGVPGSSTRGAAAVTVSPQLGARSLDPRSEVTAGPCWRDPSYDGPRLHVDADVVKQVATARAANAAQLGAAALQLPPSRLGQPAYCSLATAAAAANVADAVVTTQQTEDNDLLRVYELVLVETQVRSLSLVALIATFMIISA